MKRLASTIIIAIIALFAALPDASAYHRCRGRQRAVAARRYAPRHYRERRRDLGPRSRAGLTIAAPAAIAAGVGALIGGKKGAAVGALLGGGGGAVYYLSRNRRRY
jgi:hypothetical protein